MSININLLPLKSRSIGPIPLTFASDKPAPRPQKACSQAVSAWRGHHLSYFLAADQRMQPFEVVSQAHQAPLTGGRDQAAQRELAKAHHFLNNANHGFDRTLAQPVNRLANVRLELVSHLDQRAGLLRRWLRGLGKKLTPVPMMRFASGGNIGLNWPATTTITGADN